MSGSPPGGAHAELAANRGKGGKIGLLKAEDALQEREGVAVTGEIDGVTVRRANHIVCDSIEQCKLEAGDFVEPLEAGAIDWPLVHELSEVVAETATGRALPEDITLFKSVGLAMEDVAMAAKLLDLDTVATLSQSQQSP